MTVKIIKTHCRARVKNSPRENIPEESCVRLYKQSPEDICLQIRGEKRFASVTIFPQEARQIAEALIEIADLFLEPLAPGELLRIAVGSDR
jgi:hypothetical protein